MDNHSLYNTVTVNFSPIPAEIVLDNFAYAQIRGRIATLKFIDGTDSAGLQSLTLCYVNTYIMEMYRMQPGQAFPYKRQCLNCMSIARS